MISFQLLVIHVPLLSHHRFDKCSSIRQVLFEPFVSFHAPIDQTILAVVFYVQSLKVNMDSKHLTLFAVIHFCGLFVHDSSQRGKKNSVFVIFN